MKLEGWGEASGDWGASKKGLGGSTNPAVALCFIGLEMKVILI